MTREQAWSIALILSYVVMPTVDVFGERVTDEKTKIDLKVIVTGEGGAKLHDAPGGTPLKDLEEMQIRFVLKTEKGTKTEEVGGEKWYRVSQDGDATEGWVPASSVSEWKTRSALKPNGAPNRQFEVKRTGGQQPIVYDGTAPDNYQLLAPILEPRVNNSDPYSVLVFGANTQGSFGEVSDRIAGKNVETMQFSDAKLEIVFVIDTTASMQPLFDGVKEVVAQIAVKAAGLKDKTGKSVGDRLRFGLVVYQDATPGLKPANVQIPLTSANQFADAVRPLRVAEIGSEEWQEDVAAGLKLAFDQSGAVGWSNNSSKHVILCGDASSLRGDDPKSTTKKSIADILSLAKPTVAEDAKANRATILCHSIFALNKEGEPDWPQGRIDFKDVAENGGSFTGAYVEMIVSDPSSKRDVVDKFAVEQIPIALDVLGGKPLPPTQIQKSNIAQGLYRLKDGKPFVGVAFGTALERNDNDQEVALEAWFLRYPEMQRLKSQLRFILDSLRTLGASERKSSEALLSALSVAFAQAGVGQPASTTTLGAITSGLPLKNDLLNLTIDELARKDDQAFNEWLDLLEASEKGVSKILEIQPGGGGIYAWLVLGEQKPGAPPNQLVTFVPIDQLP